MRHLGDTFILADLGDLVTAEDEIGGTPFHVTKLVFTVSEDNLAVHRYWSDYQGVPESCLGAFMLPYLQLLDDPNGYDQTIQVGYFSNAAHFGYVFGRIFASAESAALFLEEVPEIANACPDGYSP